MNLRTKRNVLINLASANTVSAASGDEQQIVIASGKHYYHLNAIGHEKAESLLSQIAKAMENGVRILDVEAV